MPRSVGTTWSITPELIRVWREIAPKGRTMHLPAGRLIYAQEAVTPCFYLIEKGAVRAASYQPNGAVLVLEIMGPGSLFGEGAAFDRQPRQVTTETLSAVTLVEFNAEAVAAAMEDDPRLALVLLKIISSKQRSLIPRLAMTVKRSHAGALLNLFLRFASFGEMSVRLSHSRLAEIIGASRITVTRAMARLRSEGIVTAASGTITLISKEKALARLDELP